MTTDNTSQENVGEVVVYTANVCGSAVLSVREYTPEAEINEDQDPPFIMSVSYLSGSKRGTVFLLTMDGRVCTKIYEYSSKDHEYHLWRQGKTLMDTVEPLFDQFESDFRISPYLQALDFDSVSMGKFISKRFRKIHPKRTHISVIKEFEANRDALSYAEKLAQQLGRRNDPIEYVLKILHAWKVFVERCNQLRREKEREMLNAKKRHSGEKIFSYMEDPKTMEEYFYDAIDELEKMKAQIASGCDEKAVLKIQARLPKIREIIDQQDDISDSIEDALEEPEVEPVDLNLSELFG